MTSLDVGTPARASVSGHFRLRRDVYDSLEEEARTLNMSLNTLVSQVLTNHIRDDWVVKDMGIVEMPRAVSRAVLSMIPDNRLDELGRVVARAVHPTMMLERSGVIDLAAVLSDLRFMSRTGVFSMHESMGKGERRITLVHDNGPKFSKIFGSLIPAMFALVGVTPKIMVTDDSVSFEY